MLEHVWESRDDQMNRLCQVTFLCSSPQDLLTRHKLLVAEFLEQNYDVVSKCWKNFFLKICLCLARKSALSIAEGFMLRIK